MSMSKLPIALCGQALLLTRHRPLLHVEICHTYQMS